MQEPVYSPNKFILLLKEIKIKIIHGAGRQWPVPLIPATQEAEIRRIAVQNQPGQIVHKTQSQKNPSQKRSWWSG
jgi:hypothetical protein